VHVGPSRSADEYSARGQSVTRSDVTRPRDCSTTLRRFVGPNAVDLAILCRPEGPSPDPVAQAETAYRSLAGLLAADRASFRDLTSEMLFLRDIRRDLPALLEVRARMLADLDPTAGATQPAFIQQAPLDADAAFELAASAVVPRDRATWWVRDVPAAPPCACEGCQRSSARLVRLGSQTSLHTTNIYGTGGGAFEQASNMFREAERLLGRCGMEFRDVVRTWIYLRDIDRDYHALNRARREFFLRHRIEPRPASTGVQGVPFPDAHDFSIRLEALRSSRPLDISPMSTPTLNEAWNYGADFSRGLSVADANKVALYVSGTASIDAAGLTVHVGDFAAQADRMLHNIASLLAQRGASFADVVSGVTYLKNPSDTPVLRSLLRQGGFDDVPFALLEAPLCRPELLCETEVVAMLPLGTAAA
jgi:enamine deaminase RidA (YjgF/YER057c/UK114 family)